MLNHSSSNYAQAAFAARAQNRALPKHALRETALLNNHGVEGAISGSSEKIYRLQGN